MCPIGLVVTTTYIILSANELTFWYRLTQLYLEKWPLKWRESILGESAFCVI